MGWTIVQNTVKLYEIWEWDYGCLPSVEFTPGRCTMHSQILENNSADWHS